jgi:hypothetical protein
MKIDMCPERYNNDTIIVPEKVVSLSQTCRVCKPSNVVEDINGVGNSPSIMLVIDHSGSMSGITGYSTSNRHLGFTVTKAIIDTIYKKYPKAEIGIVLFQNVLYLDTKNHKYVGLPDDYPYLGAITTQGYLTLIQLDTLLSGGERRISVLKDLLNTHKVTVTNRQGLTFTTTELDYKPHFEPDGYTNINTAFDAAKIAMRSARNPKQNQYQFIIFLSDGDLKPDSTSILLHGGKNPYEFQNGTDVPTTFTVYFVTAGEDIPQSITGMTRNVKRNNFSQSNPLSDVWVYRPHTILCLTYSSIRPSI